MMQVEKPSEMLGFYSSSKYFGYGRLLLLGSMFTKPPQKF
jgi:hypothetical protein